LQRDRVKLKVTTSELALAATLAAVYVVSTFFPISPFIGGGPGFITAEILMLPLIAFLLRPPLAAASITAGSLGMALFGTSIYGVFGPLGILVPIIATVLGSFAFHYRLGFLLPWTYVSAGAVYYILFSQGGTLLWLIPYAIVIVSPLAVLKMSGPIHIGLLSLYTAMCEQVTLNVLSIAALGLVGPIWTGITPFMFTERAVATIGGAVLIVALKSRLGERLATSFRTLRR
jgi:hypothetical protein